MKAEEIGEENEERGEEREHETREKMFHWAEHSTRQGQQPRISVDVQWHFRS